MAMSAPATGDRGLQLGAAFNSAISAAVEFGQTMRSDTAVSGAQAGGESYGSGTPHIALFTVLHYARWISTQWCKVWSERRYGAVSVTGYQSQSL